MPVSNKVAAKRRATDLRLRRAYGITLEEYELVLKHQRGRCAICKQPPAGKKRMAVDHNHKTGLVRGLLCWICNKVLGRFQDNDEKVRNAAAYVTNPPASIALGRMHFTAPHRVGTKVRAKALAKMAQRRKK